MNAACKTGILRGGQSFSRICILLLTSLVASFAIHARAQWVYVDPAYPAGGAPSAEVTTLAVQSDGRLLVSGLFTNIGGVSQSYFARLDTNGVADATFRPELDNRPGSIQPLPDGRILIDGTFTNVNGVALPGMAILLNDGSLDTNFVPPELPADVYLVPTTGPDGSIFVRGNFTNLDGILENHLARLKDDGSVDPTFHSPFLATDWVFIRAVQPDGKPLISGSFSNVDGFDTTNLVRLNTDGTVDTTFRCGVPADYDITRTVLQPDGKILAVVNPVISFPVSGPISEPLTNVLTVVFAEADQLIRLNRDGSLDPSFKVTLRNVPYIFGSPYIRCLEAESDGHILIGGEFYSVNGVPRSNIARLESDGSLDFCYEVPLADEMYPITLVAEPDASVIVGGFFKAAQGQSHPYLARLLPPPGCAPGVIEMGVPSILAREDESQLVVPVVRHGGADLNQTVTFATLDGTAHGGVDFKAIAGTLQFAPGERSGTIRIPLLQSAPTQPESFQVILSQVAGGATLGDRTNTIVTVLTPPTGTAGLPDTNYVVQLDAPVRFVFPLPDGRSIIAGDFTNVDGEICPNVARLNQDGTRDTAFNRSKPLDVQAAAVDSQGRVLLGGSFETVDGIWRPGLARLKADGELDAGFAPFASWPTNTLGPIEISEIALMPDGSIVCSGSVPNPNYSGPGILKFSPDGNQDTEFANRLPPATAYDLVPQADGKIIFIGSGLGNSLFRLNPDGSADLGFIPVGNLQFIGETEIGSGQDGRITFSRQTYIINPGEPLTDSALMRLNPDGSLDEGLSTGGSYPGLGRLLFVDKSQVSADQRILLAGRFSNATDSIPALVRLRADGSLDLSFDEGAGLAPRRTNDLYAQVNAIAPLPSGGWLIGGDFGGYDGFAQRHLVKVLPETLGRPLAIQFAESAITTTETNGPLMLEVQRHGDASGFASVQLTTHDGAARAGEDYEPVNLRLDFAPGEWTKTVPVQILDDFLVDSDQDFTVELSDPSHGYALSDPAVVTITVQNNDAAVNFVSNEFHAVEEVGYALIGVTWSGAVSNNMQTTAGIFPITGESGDLGFSSVTLPYQGGTNWFRIPIRDDSIHEGTREFRLTLTGSPNLYAGPAAKLFLDDRDYPTTPARGVAGIVETMANSPGGGVYIAGDFNGVNGAPIHNIARLTPNGEVDFNFFPGAGPNGDVTAIAAQPGSGKVFIAGNFTAVNGVPRAGLARLETDGSLDASFDPGVGAQSTVGPAEIRFVLPQSNGSVYVGGTFTTFNAQPAYLMAKLDSRGAVDPSFASPFSPVPNPWIPYPQPLGPLNASEISAAVQQVNGEFIVAKNAPNVGLVLWPIPIYPHPVSAKSSAWSLIRLGLTGQPDGRFGSNELAITGNPVNALALSQIGDVFAGVSQRYTEGAWPGVVGFDLSGKPLSYFQVRGAPAIDAFSTEIRDMVIQQDRKIIFSAAIYTTNDPAGPGERLNRAIIGRLKYDGQWDDSFSMLTCDLPLIHETGPFWFDFPTNQLAALPVATPAPKIPTVSLAQQPDGVLVLAGAFDSVSGEPRHRLARLNTDGTVRGQMVLRLMPGPPVQLMLPAEVEAPYTIETSTDLQHWSGWLRNDYPWWPAALSLSPNDHARYFRARPTPN